MLNYERAKQKGTSKVRIIQEQEYFTSAIPTA